MKNRKKGFTLVEVMIAAGIFSIITISTLTVFVNWQRSWNINEAQMDVQFEARRAMSRMAKELSQTSQGRVNINVSSDVIAFQLLNDDFTWGDQIQYSLILGPTGINQLWRTDLITGQTEVLANYVVDINPGIPGVQFVLANDAISIQLKVGKTPKGGGKQSSILLNSQVSLRNL